MGPLPSQLRSKPGSSSPKFALRLLMPLLAWRVLPPGGLTWPTASTPPLSELEKTVNQSLLDLHKVAGDKGDEHLCDFLESEYLGEQVEGIKAIGDLITKMKRAGDGLGLHLIDKEMGS